MRKIEKKIWPQFFNAVASGKKRYELRLDDFEVNEGDILVLKEWDPNTQQYTGRVIERRVAYVEKFRIDELFWPKEEIEKKGIQIISLE